MMKKTGSRVKLVVKDDDNKKLWESDSFYRKTAKDKYMNDQDFKQWFDYAVQVSVYNRITQGIFKCDIGEFDEKLDECVVDPDVHNILETTLDTNPVSVSSEELPSPLEVNESEIENMVDMQVPTSKPETDVEQVGEDYFLSVDSEDAKDKDYQSVFEDKQ